MNHTMTDHTQNAPAAPPLIACYGEALVDVILQPNAQENSLSNAAMACLGGSVFNFALASARQGVATAYLNPLSADAFGRQFHAILQTEGVALPLATLPEQACVQPTSLAMVQLKMMPKPAIFFTGNRSPTALPAQHKLSRLSHQAPPCCTPAA